MALYYLHLQRSSHGNYSFSNNSIEIIYLNQIIHVCLIVIGYTELGIKQVYKCALHRANE